MIRKTTVGILIALIALACNFSATILNHIGGVRTVIILVCAGTFFAQYQKGDCPYPVAVRRVIHANRGLLFFLGWFYFGTIIAALRGGMGELIEWKLHAISILGLFFGFFLSQNPRFTRMGIYLVGGVLFFHSTMANEYVAATGMDMREALADMSGLLGHTDYWTYFSMLTILLVCNLMEEKNKIIRIVGFCVALYLYKTILLCGFATPVALFLIGHILLGVVCFQYGKKGVVKVVARIVLAVVLVGGGIYSFYKVSTLDNDARFSSIQVRFKNMIEEPEGGGYAIEDSRFNLAKFSWKTFTESPFFGCGGTYFNNPGCGGHQAFFDYLAVYGLLGGGGAFIVFVALCFRNAYMRCRRERDWKAFAGFACAGIYLLVGIFNPGWFGGPMAAFLLYAHPFKRPRLGAVGPVIPVPQPVVNDPRRVPYGPVSRLYLGNRG